MAEAQKEDSGDSVSMVEVLEEERQLEEDANAVLGASDDKHCTYLQGYLPRQAIYACATCTTPEVEPAGVCLACCLECHEGHHLYELYTKRNFCCDCGNSKFGEKKCKLEPEKRTVNEENRYNQNFSGVYCTCHRPYPDHDDSVEDDMIQCVICEDWYHGRHLQAAVPDDHNYEEMTCFSCVERCAFLKRYTHLQTPADSGSVTHVEKQDTVGDVDVTGSGAGETDTKGKAEETKVDDVTKSVDADAKISNSETTPQPSVSEPCPVGNPGVKPSENPGAVSSTAKKTESQTDGSLADQSGSPAEVKTSLTNCEKSTDNSSTELTHVEGAGSSLISEAATSSSATGADMSVEKPGSATGADTSVEKPGSATGGGMSLEKPGSATGADTSVEKPGSVTGAGMSVEKPQCLYKALPEAVNDSTAEPRSLFWRRGWRNDLCVCEGCKTMYSEKKVPFITDRFDTITVYEARGRKRTNSTSSQYERGMEALGQMDRVQQVEMLHGFNDMKSGLIDYLKKFADNGKVVKEEDIREFFTDLSSRKRQRTEMSHFCK